MYLHVGTMYLMAITGTLPRYMYMYNVVETRKRIQQVQTPCFTAVVNHHTLSAMCLYFKVL